MRLYLACVLMAGACTAWHDVSIGADRHDVAHDDDDDDHAVSSDAGSDASSGQDGGAASMQEDAAGPRVGVGETGESDD